jgi:hypothetical protein
MSIFSKIFGKRKKEEKKEAECWYNNHHEKEKGEMELPVDTGALSGDNSYLYATAQQAAKHQN